MMQENITEIKCVSENPVRNDFGLRGMFHPSGRGKGKPPPSTSRFHTDTHGRGSCGSSQQR